MLMILNFFLSPELSANELLQLKCSSKAIVGEETEILFLPQGQILKAARLQIKYNSGSLSETSEEFDIPRLLEKDPFRLKWKPQQRGRAELTYTSEALTDNVAVKTSATVAIFGNRADTATYLSIVLHISTAVFLVCAGVFLALRHRKQQPGKSRNPGC